MPKKNYYSVTLVLVFILCNTVAIAFNPPKIEFVKDGKDYGTIHIDSLPKDKKFTLEIEYKNVGDKPLSIVKANACCGTTIIDYDMIVQSGGTGVAKIEFTPANVPHRVRRNLTLEYVGEGINETESATFRIIGIIADDCFINRQRQR